MNKVPKPLLATEMLEHGLWLKTFSVDLDRLLSLEALNKTLEIADPLTPLPKATR